MRISSSKSMNSLKNETVSKKKWRIKQSCRDRILKIPEAQAKIKELEEKWEHMKENGTLLKNQVDEDLVAEIFKRNGPV